MTAKAIDMRWCEGDLPTGPGLDGMARALALVESASPAELRACAGGILQASHALAWVSCLYLDGSGRWLGSDGNDVRFDCDDFRHPYAHAIRQGKPLRLGLLEARSRLDHADFQAQVAALSGGLQLVVRPLRALDGKREWLGALAMAGEAASLARLEADGEFAAFEALLCRLWAGLTRHQGERQREASLRQSLAQLSDGARRQALAERLAADLLGGSKAMQALRSQVVRAAETNLAVLLQGETGTGKDRVARAIHRLSGRREGAFMAINCAAIPESLLESELFGHAKGAFSGADRAREGLISQADGGTLFLDEVGDMPLPLQAKLLRALQEGEVEPLGSNEIKCVDVRVMAATSRDLEAMVEEGSFRSDLYYRLNVLRIQVPPLRERLADLGILCETLLGRIAAESGEPRAEITSEAVALLQRHSWPGNIRELRNVLEQTLALNEACSVIDVPELRTAPPHASMTNPLPPPTSAVRPLAEVVLAAERDALHNALAACGGNKSRAARMLGIPRSVLYDKLARLSEKPDM